MAWSCPVCDKSLAGTPAKGRVSKHANKKGGLCTGTGRLAERTGKTPTGRGKPTRLAKAISQGERAPERSALPHRRGPTESDRGNTPVLCSQTLRLPKNNQKKHRDRMNEEYWSLFPDVLQEDLETDRNWLRVRKGPTQGTGRRR